MNFHTLPESLRDRPLDSSSIMARAVDQCCPVRDRRTQCLTVILCDDELRIHQPVTITGVPVAPDAADVALVLRPIAGLLREIRGTVLIARGKPQNGITDADRRVHQYLLDECREEGVRLLGFYVAGPTTVRRMPDPPLVPV